MELKYFDLRGAGETCRLILAIAGKDFKDTRFPFQPDFGGAFKDAKESGELKMNMQRAPVMVLEDGSTFGQSKAIERYLSRKFGLMGSGEVEAALVDCLAENVRDVFEKQYNKGFGFFGPGTDEEKAALKKEWFDTELPMWLGKLEDSVAAISTTKGFAVGSALTYADIAIFCLLKDGMADEKEITAKAAEACPNLNAIADGVAANPKVVKWLSERPETPF
mmetsp:Transcript_48740/g.58993  ORF Transcript_48740/g.58993 Transcript_48740/m.58993 type:complete len:221 (+) Transcript_48740:75-737(+)